MLDNCRFLFHGSVWIFALTCYCLATAKADPLIFEYRRATSNTPLKKCPAVEGLNVTTLYVREYGRKIELPADYKRTAYSITTNPRPMYFACGVEKESGKYAVFARRQLLFSKTYKYFLTAADFPEKPTTPVATPTPSPSAAPTGGATPIPTPPSGSVGCTSTKSWPGSFIYKTVGSNHFSPSDPRRTTIGLVMKTGAGVATPSCIDIVAANGAPVAQLGLYSRGAGWHARYYGGTGCGTRVNGAGLAALAQQTAGSNNVYVRINGACFGPTDAAKCRGSSQCG